MTSNHTSRTPSTPPQDVTTKTIRTTSVQQTENYGAELAQHVKPGDTIALHGQLGAGKTHLVRGLAQALGVLELSEVASPTYAITHVYETSAHPLIHMDCYRLHDADDAYALGLDAYFIDSYRLSIKVIEWAEKVPELLPATHWDIRIRTVDDTTREISQRFRHQP